jgi:hypothetical protein
LDDIRDGFVSIEAARSEYGVVARHNGGDGLDAIELDLDATSATRRQMRAQHGA